jgi:hypothetical protein
MEDIVMDGVSSALESSSAGSQRTTNRIDMRSNDGSSLLRVNG